MASLADIAGRLRHSQVSAAQTRHAGQIILEGGDVSRPIDVHSMRKSILSVLVGLAYDRRDINLDTTLRELGIDDTPALSAEEKSATINDLLTARSGVHLPVADGGTLGRPSRGSHPPGTLWCYNNWDFNVLGHVYERITGRSVFVAFEHELAGPLGMTDWDSYRYGSYRYRADILGGTTRYPNYKFHVSARDTGKLGQLCLDNGVWNGRELLSAEWITRSTRAISRTNRPIGCWVCTAIAGG